MATSRGICVACRMRGLQRPASRVARRNYSAISTPVKASSSLRFSASSPSPQTSSLLLSRTSALSRNGFRAIALGSLPVASIRLQSTTSTPPDISPSSSSPSLDGQADSLNLSYDYVPPPLPQSPEVGWLHDLGINFGYGPSSCIQWLFEHVHVLSGMPFWGSIVATAAACRFIMVPLIMQSSDTSSRLGAVATLTKPKMDELKLAAAAQDQIKIQRVRGEIRAIYKGAGVQMWKLALPFMQIPIGFGLWRLTRNMADLPVPGLDQGGLLWFTDLTVSDPLFILPFAVALLQHLSVRTGIESSTMASPQMRKVILFGLPALAIPFIGLAPAAVQLNFATTAAVALLTNSILRNPSLRSKIGLAPFVKNAASATGAAAAAATETSAYRGTITVSARAKDHPDNVRRAREAAAAAEKAAAANVPWSQRLKPSAVLQSGRSAFSSLGKQIEKAMPAATQQQQTATQKRKQRAADEYERKRAAELARERAEFEQGQPRR